MEEGREFWGRYPLEFQAGISARAYISPLHEKMLKQHYFPVVGSVPKHFVGKNRRHLDFNVARFEDDTHKDVDRDAWGLPTPNLEASYISLAKYAKDVYPLSPKMVADLNTAFKWTERQFSPVMSHSRVKTLEEVVAGLDMSTSPGWPWVGKYKTKRAMVDEWKDFHKYMEEDWERLKDPNWTAVFGNSLKEEIRPAEKITQNSIRTFTAGPIEATIHGNRLFEDMNQKFYDAHLRVASVVGFSPLKGGWDALYRKLAKFKQGFALDESQYDSSLRAYLMWSCAQFRWNMLREEDQTEENLVRLKTYYRNLVNTLIVTSEGIFIMKQGGNPSGSVNTITDNTIILYTLLAYAWIVNAPEEMQTYEAFEEHTSKALVGDDNTFTVSEDAINFYNARSIIPTWAEIGITTTTDSMDPRPVEELDFLSAHTTFVDGVAVPLYARDKLLTSLLYSRFPNDPAYTLTRATALQRVAWADIPMRRYLQEFVAWMMDEYDHVLRDEQTWKMAKAQIPTSQELKELFLGKERTFGMVAQGVKTEKSLVNNPPCRTKFCQVCGIKERSNSRIKSFLKSRKLTPIQVKTRLPKKPMNGLPQRQRRKRSARKKKQNPGMKRGPPLPSGAFSRKGPGRRSRRKSPRKDFAGVQNSNRIDGLRRGKRRHNFSEDEFIVDLVGSTSFGSGTSTSALQFACNPGQVATFPWLSQIAQRYEKYVFTKLEFYYKHEVSQFATAGTVGKAILSFDYDAADAPPVSKTQMMDTDPHADRMPCEDFVLKVDCREAFNNGPKYVRPGNLPGAADIKTYDAGLLNFAASGTADAVTKLGELHVRYAGWFEKPILESTTSAPVNMQVSVFQSSAPEASAATTVAKTLLLATASVNGLNAVNTNGSIVLPAGNYLVDASCVAIASATANTKMDIQVGGVSVFSPATNIPVIAATLPTTTTNGSVYISVNGSQALTVVVTDTFAAGTVTNNGYLRIAAV